MSHMQSSVNLPSCPVCREPVKLEAAKTDEDGHAIHEDCYWAKINRERGADDAKTARLGTRLRVVTRQRKKARRRNDAAD